MLNDLTDVIINLKTPFRGQSVSFLVKKGVTSVGFSVSFGVIRNYTM